MNNQIPAVQAGNRHETDEEKGKVTRVDDTQYDPPTARPLATAADNVPLPTAASSLRKPWWWVSPNPSGAPRELMDREQLADWLCDWELEGPSLDGIEMTISAVWLTDAEVEALPDV